MSLSWEIVDVPVIMQLPALSLAPTVPSPAHAHARIRFTLPYQAVVSLAVYDVAGRRVAMPLDRVLEPAGAHEVDLDTARLPAGSYVYRLSAGGVTRTRKMIVLK